MSEGDFDTCPVCGYLSVDVAGDPINRSGSILVPVECWVCGAQWLQRYVYAGDEEIEPLEE